jgi:hypothetical protein
MAYGGQLNALDYCAGAYAPFTGVSPNDCNRGSAPIDEQLQAVIGPTAPVGGAVVATQPDTLSGGCGPLPATFPLGVVMYLNVSLPVGTQGSSRFAISFGADGATRPATGEAPLRWSSSRTYGTVRAAPRRVCSRSSRRPPIHRRPPSGPRHDRERMSRTCARRARMEGRQVLAADGGRGVPADVRDYAAVRAASVDGPDGSMSSYLLTR